MQCVRSGLCLRCPHLNLSKDLPFYKNANPENHCASHMAPPGKQKQTTCTWHSASHRKNAALQWHRNSLENDRRKLSVKCSHLSVLHPVFWNLWFNSGQHSNMQLSHHSVELECKDAPALCRLIASNIHVPFISPDGSMIEDPIILIRSTSPLGIVFACWPVLSFQQLSLVCITQVTLSPFIFTLQVKGTNWTTWGQLEGRYYCSSFVTGAHPSCMYTVNQMVTLL